MDRCATDIFDYLSLEQRKEIKATFMESIILTDMAFHFESLEKFKNLNSNEIGDESNLNFLIGLMLHAADIGNPILKFDFYIEQAALVTQEFHDQTISEKLNNLEVTTFM